MKRYFLYLLFYSFGGFILERIINLVFLGYYWDNSVLIGPYQPLYGSGVVLTILFMDYILNRWNSKQLYKDGLLLIAAIFFTGLVEASTGYMYQILYDMHLWDYGRTFTCNLEYVCVLPTSMFGVISFFVVKFIHPYVKKWMSKVPDKLYYILLGIFIIDVILTHVFL